MNRETKLQQSFRLTVFVMLFLAVFMLRAGTAAKPVRADNDGFVTENKVTYYYKDGEKVTGWLTLGKKTYYFFHNGSMAKGWQVDTNGDRRYFSKKGVMYTGWKKNSTGRRYFAKKTGTMTIGWAKISGKRYYFIPATGYAAAGLYKVGKYYRYFDPESCFLVRGWVTDQNGAKRFFKTAAKASKDGIMATGKTVIDERTYYFKKSNGKMQTGWITIGEDKYYFGEDGAMVTGVVTIDGVKQEFDENGVYLGEYDAAPRTDPGNAGYAPGGRTIKNYLLGALVPVGRVLYVWGGGWNDAARIGLTKTMTNWYKSQSSSYDYNNYRDLSVANRAKGFDCSGFVGWCAYQTMHNTSNQTGGYTVVSGEVGGTYVARGWGSTMNQNYLSGQNYVLKAGDIGYNEGHVWIVIGQCKDKSVVIVHSTPQAGVQIAGTTTPSGSYNSQAQALAAAYMKKYSGTTKYEYKPSVGNYIKQYSFFRWNRNTLADPEGYMNKYADAILADLFASK